MAPRAIDAKAAERCASIVGAKQKGDEPPPSHVSGTDVALSSFPQTTTRLRAAAASGRHHGADLGGSSFRVRVRPALTPGADAKQTTRLLAIRRNASTSLTP